MKLAVATILLVASIAAFADEKVDYLRDVKPILQAKCYSCHGALRQRGELRLDTAELLKKGGGSGQAIQPGQSDDSLLIEYVSGGVGKAYMPPEGEGEALTDEQVSILKRWIDQGAVAPEEDPPGDPREHWAYHIPTRPPVPDVQHNWVLNPIDAFIAEVHQEKGLQPAKPVDRATLLRRVMIDLIGLPPTREELHAFLSDTSPTAYEAVVDRLLNDPRYGQRWGRHWLDVWRYSDWYGSRHINELRNSRRHIWRWRDWTVEAVNADKGYDRMLVEMLAADELAPGDRDLQRAGGYLGRSYYLFNRHVWLQDTVEYLGTSILGMTLKCCRCHDHKYDPVSQQEYYQLRAFFEPLQVRTDQIPGKPELIKENVPAMAAAGAKLQDGYDCVFDGDPSAVTYLLKGGNEKTPDTETQIEPDLPSVLGIANLNPETVELPLEAYYPDLAPVRRAEMIAAAEQQHQKAQQRLQQAQSAVALRRQRLEAFDQVENPSQDAASFFTDDFQQDRPDAWKVLSGRWERGEGGLRVMEPGHFLTIVTQREHPPDFRARIRYTTTQPGSIHSVGVAFDVVGTKDWQAVYTYPGDRSAVQAFHRKDGREVYPLHGIIRHPIKLDEEITLDLAVRGALLNVWVNGELKIAYALPIARQRGNFALWTHSGTAVFHEIQIDPLPADALLTADATTGIPSPIAPLSREQLQETLQIAVADEAVAQADVKVGEAEMQSLQARLAAELAKHTATPDPQAGVLAASASKAERQLAVVKAERALLAARHDLARLQSSASSDDKQKQTAQQAVATAEQQLAAAVAEAAKESDEYTPIGMAYPKTSTGRRLALARAIASRDNPLTARVAVNHIWLRHFGAALVPTVFNFGLNGKPPTHPKLLDWLAVEFMENGWSMKHLHRLVVTSQTYRMASDAGDIGESNRAIDEENQFYWRAHPKRMEAEVVRDGLLHLAGMLDVSLGGPDLDPLQADAIPRRSLYFRHTPDEKPVMLQLFDAPDPAECYQRDVSIIPQQALALVNSDFSLTQARRIARNLSKNDSDDPVDFVAAAFEHLLSRPPSELERDRCVRFLTEQTARYADPSKLTPHAAGTAAVVKPSPDARLRARENLVHVLLNYNEFVTIR